MEFLAIVAAALLVYWRGAMPEIQRDAWYDDWVARLSSTATIADLPAGPLLISLLLPVLAVALALDWLGGYGFGLPAFLVSLWILIYSLGRGDLRLQLGAVNEDLQRNDMQAVYHDAAVFNTAHRESQAEDWSGLRGELLRGASYRYLESYMAVIFWFAVAGAPGALLYRLSLLYRDRSVDNPAAADLADQWLWLLEWVPVRLLGLTLGLVGDFGGCMRRWRGSLFAGGVPAAQLLGDYAEGALGSFSGAEEKMTPEFGMAQLEALARLFARAMVCWFSVIALIVIMR